MWACLSGGEGGFYLFCVFRRSGLSGGGGKRPGAGFDRLFERLKVWVEGWFRD